MEFLNFKNSAALLALVLLTVAGCNREKRPLRATPEQRAIFGDAAMESSLRPAGPTAGGHESQSTNPFRGNAYSISEGQRLFDWYNCSGCHGHGGGSIGPPFIDTKWIYGGAPENIFDSIVKGRPNGMPAWGGRIPEYQVWQLVAYVRSLNEQQPRSATPARSDALENKTSTYLERRFKK